MIQHFRCPYCNHATTIIDTNYWEKLDNINIKEPNIGKVGLFSQAITCPNPKCEKLWLKVGLYNIEDTPFNTWNITKKIKEWQLMPESNAKILPDYIPKAIKNDYYEANRICKLSPKASATLARRCLQGMIRDFWGIKKANLFEEIKALKDKVTSSEWEAIDAVRKVGNIGAHMEKDINLIVDIDPQEAELLLKLIEQFVEDWYITRYEKEKRVKEIKDLANRKQQERNTANS